TPKFEYRNPKSETSPDYRSAYAEASARQRRGRRIKTGGCFPPLPWAGYVVASEFSSLDIRYCFELRASDFEFTPEAANPPYKMGKFEYRNPKSETSPNYRKKRMIKTGGCFEFSSLD